LAQMPPAARLQATHGPSQLELQQTPSTQNPDAHWQPLEQDPPFAVFAAQTVPEQ
jgi:hypothetical protein